MIPASHIKFSDDRKTAWVVFDDDDNERLARSSRAFISDLDRPCSTCGGRGEVVVSGGYYTADDWPIPVRYGPCPDCHGSGRPCFEIEVRTECTCERRTIGGGAGWYDHATDCPVRSIKGYLASDGWHFVRTLTVSVMKGTVALITDGTKPCDNGEAHIRDDGPGYLPMNRWVAMPARGVGEYVRLPSAAAPGMFAVLLDIHKGTT